MSSPIPEEHQDILLRLARDSIRHGLDNGVPLDVTDADLPDELLVERATFVTLEIAGGLRGCIGTLEARQPLAHDVAENAFAAAFRDPRFPALIDHEFENIDIHISILSPPEPLEVTSEEDLLRRMRPGIDGLILEDGLHRGTFLPVVWEQLPEPRDFLHHLKLKAGLPPRYWSDTLRIHRYTATLIPTEDA